MTDDLSNKSGPNVKNVPTCLHCIQQFLAWNC